MLSLKIMILFNAFVLLDLENKKVRLVYNLNYKLWRSKDSGKEKRGYNFHKGAKCAFYWTFCCDVAAKKDIIYDNRLQHFSSMQDVLVDLSIWPRVRWTFVAFLVRVPVTVLTASNVPVAVQKYVYGDANAYKPNESERSLPDIKVMWCIQSLYN